MEPTNHSIAIPRAAEYIALLEQRLSPRTMMHTLSVAACMASLASLAGVPGEAAITAGLLHDLKKDTGKETLLREALAYGLDVSPIQRENPKLLHGPVAAETCRRELGVTDDAVYEAIYWHTTGRPGLGRTGLLLYFADYAEPLRDRPDAARARERCQTEGFFRALYFVACQKVQYIRTRGSVDPISEDFFAWLGQELLRQGHLSEHECAVGLLQ
ncbi:MAG TPA: bis(5'-nucleosyl)-tetraphosphatase (symmetrical) YqeK [Candidatus Hydrogenedentes bacterium]|nr:bis(5'-nucleosyl)-tetraphosphatase (symmetrical) YqeK [Candidatus Hydrogenedentota bacterium]